MARATPKPPRKTAAAVRLNRRQRLAWLRLIRSENVGPATFRALVNEFGGAEAAMDALPMLSRRGGRIHDIRLYGEDEAEGELEAAEALGAHLVRHRRAGISAGVGASRRAPAAPLRQGQPRSRVGPNHRAGRRPQRLGHRPEIHARACHRSRARKASSSPPASPAASTRRRMLPPLSAALSPCSPVASTSSTRRRMRSCSARSASAAFFSASARRASRHAARTSRAATG